MRALFVLGRTICGGYFLYNGINHLIHEKMTSQYAAHKGVAAPDLAVAASGALLIAGGMSVLAAVRPRQGLVAIIPVLIPLSLQMPRFWDVEAAPARSVDM